MAILDIPEDSPEWHSIRLQHIGGSEVAGLFGQQPEFGQSRLTLHLVKAGVIPPEDVDDSPGSIVWFGKRKEATIAHMAAELYGWNIKKGGYAKHDRVRGMGESQDYVMLEPGADEARRGWTGPGLMQCKNTHWLNHRSEWVNDEPPHWILLQLQHGIACAGYQWGAIVCEVGGNMILAYRYAARPATIDMLEHEVGVFWADVDAYVAGDLTRLPKIDGTSSTARSLAALYPSKPKEEPLDLSGSNTLPTVAAQFLVAQANKSASEEAYRLAKNELEAELGGSTVAFSTEYWIKASVVDENPGRVAKPGEIIGKRKGSRRLSVKGRLGQ